MGIVDSVKEVLKVAETVNNIELYKKLSELQARIMELDEEKNELLQEVSRLKEQDTIEKELEFKDNRYWRVKEGRRDGPFCSVCWDIDRRLVREISYLTGHGVTRYTCHYCSQVKRESRS